MTSWGLEKDKLPETCQVVFFKTHIEQVAVAEPSHIKEYINFIESSNASGSPVGFFCFCWSKSCF